MCECIRESAMPDRSDLEDLVASFNAEAFRAALEEAFRRGQAATRNEILHTLGATPMIEPRGSETGDDAARAPRGLTREVVTDVLRGNDPMTTQEVQELAQMVDDRVLPKTVYNELNRERGKRYTYAMGRWSLIHKPGSVEEEVENLLA